MAYSDVALLSQDYDFMQRVNACVAAETQDNPTAWTQTHIWVVSSAPGFGDAYASALASSVERPGNDPAVISDGQILSAVQGIMTQENTVDATEPQTTTDAGGNGVIADGGRMA